MRKLILNVAVSLDGYIEGPAGEYDWCFTDQDYGMAKFLKETDTILFGRKSYELLISLEPDAYPGKKKIVFSTTLTACAKGYHLISSNVPAEVEKMKKGTGKHIWVWGGASLTKELLNAGLIDELMLSVHPIILGAGKPLFSGIDNRIPLELKNTETFSSGLLQLLYTVKYK